MTLNTLYGIGGVGKDTVASELKETLSPEVKITSASRLSMYLLGIATDFTADTPVGREEYVALESVPQADMIALEQGPYREFVHELSKRPEQVLLLSHLVFALYLDRKITYLTDRPTPDWFVAENDHIIQLVASPQEILARRQADASHRERPTTIEQIIEHQLLCDQEWTRIGTLPSEPRPQLHIVHNSDLRQAVAEVHKVLS